MAIYHLRIKMVTRSKGNTVHKLAYNTATKLKCQRTQDSWDYRKKPVSHVQILLSEDAPQWARDLQKLVERDKNKGLQTLSNLVEAAEKRVDSQVYRELEFALPRELTDEQNRKLAEEYIQDQCCQMGMLAVQAFHIDYDKKTGKPNPHCHTLLLTRRLTETGLAETKDRTWNQEIHHLRWREQWAAYANFHLRMHGFEANLDHRSNKERGFETEPQTKLGRNIQEMERRTGHDVKSLENKAVTQRGQEYQTVKLRNLYRIIKKPEIIFEMITKSQSTFMWGDVQKKLAQYVDDVVLFQRLDAQLKGSKELVFLRKLEPKEYEGTLKDPSIYTSKEMLKAEIQLVSMAESLSQHQKHGVKDKAFKRALEKYNQKLCEHGGLSQDQVAAIEHMVKPSQVSCVVGYAGAGKTTALEVAKEIWEKSGYAVYGLAPTGRARENLKQNSFKSYTLHQFLKDYENGRCQFKPKSVLVLDEGGMVNTQLFYQFLCAVKRLGVKAVIVGDGAQLQPVEAGPAFRLVTERLSYAKLEYVVRQKESWQKEATVLFGQNKTREALQKYFEHSCIQMCQEKSVNLDAVLQKQDLREVVLLYNLSRRIAGNIYYEMIADLKQQYFLEEDVWKYIRTHADYDLYAQWRDRRDRCAQHMLANLDSCRPLMKELGVDPVQFALNFANKSLERKEQIKEAQPLVKEWNLPQLEEHQQKHICDPREQTKKDMVQAWYGAYQKNPNEPQLMMAYSNKDVRDLNDEARHLLKKDKVIGRSEYVYTVHREEDTDFGKTIIRKEERAFAKGDRLIFTKNDKGLGVDNGTLGTIESLGRNNIKVRLDNTKDVVSFAPKLYPHFDQGWAATIHKNQGATAKECLVLASYEMYRNLIYVGMTRHNDLVKLFASEIDFWRIEKLFDRLSRSQEKLSSLDYVEAKKLIELMREDEAYLSKLFDGLGNQLEAIKYVSKRAFEEVSSAILGKSYTYEGPVAQASILEEDRARAFFDDQKIEGKAEETEFKFGMRFQARSAQIHQDQNGLQQQVEEVFTSYVKPDVQEKTIHKYPTSISHHIDTPLQAKNDTPLISPSKPSFYLKPITYYDRDEVLKYLSDSKVEQLFHDHIHHWVNAPKATKQGIHIRYGSGKGFAINLEEKTWYSHYGSEGGDIFKYISRSKNISYGDAIKQVAEEIHVPASTYLTPEEQAKRNQAWQQEKAEQEKQDYLKGKEKTMKVYRQTIPIKGTLGEKYLREYRAFEGEIPSDIRFARSRYTPEGNKPALVSFARDSAGLITGYQEIFLDSTGNKAKEVEIVKKSGGYCKTAAVRIQKGEGVTYIAEGIETALSIKAAGVKGEILSGFGRYVFKNVEPSNKAIILCADYDGVNARTHETIIKDKQHLENKGYTVHIVWPATEGEKKIDFNDILKTYGKNKVKELLQEQLQQIIEFAPTKRQETQIQNDRHETGKEREQKRLVSSSLEPGVSAATAKNKEQGILPSSLDASQSNWQTEGLIEHYLGLKKERGQYSVVGASPETKAHCVGLRRQIEEAAFAITQDKALMTHAKQQGIEKMILNDGYAHKRSLEKTKGRDYNVGF